MTFTITRHASGAPPECALELLGARIPRRVEDVLFSMSGAEIAALIDRDEAVWMTRDERVDIGRRAVLEALDEVCERSPELQLDWYAVSPAS
jgi:hypothetical protein